MLSCILVTRQGSLYLNQIPLSSPSTLTLRSINTGTGFDILNSFPMPAAFLGTS